MFIMPTYDGSVLNLSRINIKFNIYFSIKIQDKKLLFPQSLRCAVKMMKELKDGEKCFLEGEMMKTNEHWLLRF